MRGDPKEQPGEEVGEGVALQNRHQQMVKREQSGSTTRDVVCHAVMIHRPTGRIVGPATPIFKEDWPYSLPPPATRVWRYMDYRKLEDWLRQGAIRFARCDKFTDSLDGRYSEGNQAGLSKSETAFASAYPLHGDTIEKRVADNEIGRGCTFISCWNIAKCEKARMWREYTKSPRSIAVVSSFKALQRQLPSSIAVSRVRYVPDTFPRSRLSHTSVYFYKSPQFGYENELRLLRRLQEGETVGREDDRDFARYVPVQLGKMIQEVFVHPDADSALFQELRSNLSSVLPGVRMRPSTLPRQGFVY